jgi:hypothetical protein
MTRKIVIFKIPSGGKKIMAILTWKRYATIVAGMKKPCRTYSTHLFRHFRFVLGQNIQRLRVQHRLPVCTLARLTGVPEHLIDRYELGRNVISLNELFRIACALGVGVEELTGQVTHTGSYSSSA